VAGDFDVDPEALRTLAGVFADESDRLAAAVPPFRETSYSVNDAFGQLGPSTDALQAFLDLAQRDAGELDELATFLDGTATALRAAADNYAQAEGDSRIPGQGAPG
jgi:uncharacterized protein YukE